MRVAGQMVGRCCADPLRWMLFRAAPSGLTGARGCAGQRLWDLLKVFVVRVVLVLVILGEVDISNVDVDLDHFQSGGVLD